MAKYIDKDALVAEIEKRRDKNARNKLNLAAAFEDNYLLSFLESLEVKEVDLKAELNTWRHNHFHGGRDFEASGEYLERITQLELAKHFFELGLNSQRKISYVPNIDDSLKELGVDPDSKEAKIFKESYYTALEKLKAQKGEKV